MPKDFPRHQRVGDLMQQELAVLIRTAVKDPRLSTMLTVAEVRVTADLSQAKIYITALDGNGAESVVILNRAAGFLRSQLSKRMSLRSVPSLHFLYDTTAEKGAELSALIDSALRSDRDKKKDD
jgi:ribosome-binding factor A